MHPDYREAMLDYYERACERGGHTPHLLEEAFSWHIRLEQQGSMKKVSAADAQVQLSAWAFWFINIELVSFILTFEPH